MKSNRIRNFNYLCASLVLLLALAPAAFAQNGADSSQQTSTTSVASGQKMKIKGVVTQRPSVVPLSSVPITAGPTVPIVNIGDAALSAVPGKRWQVVLYLDNNSANTVVPMINCRFTNAGKLVEQTHVLVPAVGPGTRVGMIVHGPKTDLFVDRATCAVTSP